MLSANKILFSLYRYLISPWLHLVAGPGFGCRFTVSCSEYTQRAIVQEGWLRGSFRGLKRLSQCHPWGPAEGR